jgi:mannose-6-phosphate isomerase-like protein (cupin superfamily)
MRRVVHDNKTYALVLSVEDFRPGVEFVSEPEWPLQVGLLMPPAGHAIAAHAHLPHNGRQVRTTQEFLFVISGRMEVDFFNEQGQRFQTETVGQGEALFHVLGGHAFRFPEETRLLEVKSGPYDGREKDKVFLNASASHPA